jgi:hypothetical protein
MCGYVATCPDCDSCDDCCSCAWKCPDCGLEREDCWCAGWDALHRGSMADSAGTNGKRKAR